MADDLQRQRAELERTNRLAAWADMARQVAHDIKNPLTPIQLPAEFLRRVHADAARRSARCVDSCVATILSQVSLLRQIASEFSSFASSPVARSAPTRAARGHPRGRGAVRTGLPEKVGCEVHRGRERARAVAGSRAAGPRAGERDRERASRDARRRHADGHRTRPVDGGAADRDRDTGVGMEADALERLFEPYFSTKATGTGLGLTIAKRNVELNGGTIAVTSVKGRGTTVTITLPAPPGRFPPKTREQSRR